MSPFRCRVSFIDYEGIEHAANVQAETLYEAAALAVREFKQDSFVTSKPNEKTTLKVEVFTDPREHQLRLQQVEKWAGQGSRGPADAIRRNRVKALLETS